MPCRTLFLVSALLEEIDPEDVACDAADCELGVERVMDRALRQFNLEFDAGGIETATQAVELVQDVVSNAVAIYGIDCEPGAVVALTEILMDEARNRFSDRDWETT